MCLETKPLLLSLSSDNKIVSTNQLTAINNPVFKFSYSEIIQALVTGFGGGSGAGDEWGQGSSVKHGRYLESCLAEKLSRSKWDLEVRFHVNARRAAPGVDVVGPVDVIVEADLLKELTSIVTCGNPKNKLKLKLVAKLVASGAGGKKCGCQSPIITIDFGDSDNINEEDADGGDDLEEIDLVPRMVGGKADLTEYAHFHFIPENCGDEQINLDKIVYWELESIRLEAVITGPECPFTAKGLRIYKLKVKSNFLDNGQDPDVTIHTEDGESISCHRSVLIAQSTVLEMALTGHFEEAETGEIGMLDRTRVEVMGFLSFLYQKDKGVGTERVLVDPSMTLALLEMAHKYDVVWLEEKMKEFLLKMPVQKFSVKTALRLIGFASVMIYKQPELKRKGIDALKLWTNEEVQESEAFAEVFPTAMQRDLYLESRRPY